MKTVINNGSQLIILSSYEIGLFETVKENPLLLSGNDFSDSHFIKVKDCLNVICSEIFQTELSFVSLFDIDILELFTIGDFYLIKNEEKTIKFPISSIKFYSED